MSPRLTGAALLLLAAALGTTLLGCGPSLHAVPTDAFTEPAPLLAALAERRVALRGLVAESRVEYYGEDGVRKGTVVIAAQRPGLVRFEALSPSGDFVALLVSDGERFVSFQRGEDACYEGPACPTNVGRLLPLALPPDAVVQVLLGSPPLIAYSEAEVAFDREQGRYELRLRAPERGERQVISFDPETLAPRRVAVWRDDRLLFRVAFDELRTKGEARLPTELRFRMPSREVDLSIEYRDLRVNPDHLTPRDFTFTCPAGAERLWLDCEGGAPRPVEPPAPSEER